MNRLAAAVLVCLALAPVHARAAGPAKPEPLAVQLSRFVFPEENWNKLMGGLTAQMRQVLLERLEVMADAEAAAEIGDAIAAEVKTFFTYQEILDIQASLLAKHYTDAELRQLFAFYRSPVGQKAIRIMPEVAQDANGQLMVIVQQRMPAMMERLKPLVEAAAKRHLEAEQAEAEQAEEAPKAR